MRCDIRTIRFVMLAATLGGIVWVSAGDLNPPAGPVTSTMKTLDQVEARIPVQSLSGNLGFQHIISQPGSYYLTGNIVGEAGKSGIRIDAADVTLDLNGFAMIGSDTTPGTVIFSAAENVTIRNGTLRGWAQGVALEGGRSSGRIVWASLSLPLPVWPS